MNYQNSWWKLQPRAKIFFLCVTWPFLNCQTRSGILNHCVDMVPDLIWHLDGFVPQEIWATRNLGPEWKWKCCTYNQSYVIKSAPWTILWFRILGIFSVENIKRLCAFMFQTCSNSQLLRRVLWISAEQTIGASLKHKNTQPLYIFSRVRVLHLNRLKERTWLHSFDISFVL